MLPWSVIAMRAGRRRPQRQWPRRVATAVEHRILGVDMQMSERIRHLGSPPGRPVTLPVDTDVDALWTSYTGVISNLTGESPSHKRGFGELRDRCRTGLGRLTNRLLSPAATDLAPQALELLLRSHLLRKSIACMPCTNPSSQPTSCALAI